MAEQRLLEAAVPFLDLGLLHRDLKAEIVEEIAALVDSSAFINGPQVEPVSKRAFAGLLRHRALRRPRERARRAATRRSSRQGLERGRRGPHSRRTRSSRPSRRSPRRADVCPVDVTEDRLQPRPLMRAVAAIGERTKKVRDAGFISTDSPPNIRPPRATSSARRGIAILEDACQAHGASRDGLAGGHRRRRLGLQFLPR